MNEGACGPYTDQENFLNLLVPSLTAMLAKEITLRLT